MAKVEARVFVTATHSGVLLPNGIDLRIVDSEIKKLNRSRRTLVYKRTNETVIIRSTGKIPLQAKGYLEEAQNFVKIFGCTIKIVLPPSK